MKKLKKLAAVLLSLAMTAMLSIPALAAGEYSITINNDKAGHTYEAYQIFAGDVSSDEAQEGNAEGPILSNIIWGSGVNGTALLAALKEADAEKYGECETAADVAEALGIENAAAADAAAFAEIAAEHLATVAGTATAPVEGNYVINNLAAGYYLVKDQDGSLQGDADSATEYIVQVLGNVTMEPKDSDIPTVEKKVSDEEYTQYEGAQGPDYQPPYGYGYNDVADWDIGDSVPFKLIGSIPDMSAYDTYEYIFTDTLSNGLTLQADTIKVYIARNPYDQVNNYEPLIMGADYTLDVQNVGANGGGSFSIAFEDLKTNEYVAGEQGDEYHYVIVTYDATLNTNAVIGLDGNPNSVDLQFSNDPNGDGLGRTPEDTVIVFTYELDGTKVDGEDVDTKLEGAEFVLLNGGHTQVAHIENGKLVGWIDLPEGYNYENYKEIPYETWEKFNATNNVIMTSTAEGVFGVSGLDDGTLYLLEIKAPNGYNLMENDLRIDIAATTANGQTWDGVPANALTALTIAVDQGNAENGNAQTGAVALTVTNNQGTTLPETGGIGTTIFYIIGGVLVVGAGVLLAVRLRMRTENKE